MVFKKKLLFPKEGYFQEDTLLEKSKISRNQEKFSTHFKKKKILQGIDCLRWEDLFFLGKHPLPENIHTFEVYYLTTPLEFYNHYKDIKGCKIKSTWWFQRAKEMISLPNITYPNIKNLDYGGCAIPEDLKTLSLAREIFFPNLENVKISQF